jgi:hypothetical protein
MDAIEGCGWATLLGGQNRIVSTAGKRVRVGSRRVLMRSWRV